MMTFITDMKECKDCEKEWTIAETFSSWYLEFRNYVKDNQRGVCADSWRPSKEGGIVP